MSTPRLQWMKLHTGDFLASTTDLTLEETGAAILLAMAQWEFGPLPHNNFAALARICRTTPAKFAKLWPQISRRFASRPEGLVDEELERVRQKSLQEYMKRSRAAHDTNLKKLASRIGSLGTESDTLSVTVSDSVSVSVSASHPEPEPDLAKISEALPRGGTGFINEKDPEVQRRRREAAALLERDSPTEGNA